MIDIANGGVYQVDLHGLNDSEFTGNHPCLVVQSLKEKEMYYIIPLTTYTEERWKKLRKYYCCRVLSTNSIARMDKMQVRHKSFIPHKWVDSYHVLYPTPDELDAVYKKMIAYISLSMNKSYNECKKYYKSIEEFRKICNRFFGEYQFDDFGIFNISFNSTALVGTCDLNLASHITFDDVSDVFRKYFDYRNLTVRFNKDTNKIIITVKLCDPNVLTLKEHYDTIMASKG